MTDKLAAAVNQQEREAWRRAVRLEEGFTVMQRLILTGLDEYRNSERGDAFPSNARLGRDCLTTRETVNRALRRAEELGYLTGHRSKNDNGSSRPVVWRFTIPPEGVTVGSQGCDAGITGGVTVGSHKPPKEHPTEPPNPISAHKQAYEPQSVMTFIEEEPQHRDEYINYLTTVGIEQSYIHVLDAFIGQMQGQNRTDWVGTFKAFIASLAGLTHTDSGDPLSEATIEVEETYIPRIDGFDHLDFAHAWQGRKDNVDPLEYRRAWEHALMNDTLTGTRIIAVASSEHVLRKYPREFPSIINELSKYQLSKAVSGYKKNNL